MGIEIFIQLIASAAAIVFAARWLAHASDEIAEATGLGRLFIGSLLLAASTSAPEFFVDIQATLEGSPNLASGDLLGSSLMNLLIFATLAFIFRKTTETYRTPGLEVSSFLAALLTAEIGLLIFFQPPWNFLGFNAGSYLLMGTYLIGMRFIFQKTRPLSQNGSPALPASPKRILRPLSRFFLGAAIIFFVSPLLIGAMEAISLSSGLGNTFVGSTLLALTTSFPELVSSLTAARMGRFELVIGNILGSNALNMVIFVFMDWFWKEPPLWKHLSANNLLISGIVVLNMLILTLSWGKYSKKRPKIKTWGTGAILFLSIGCYLVLYFFREEGWR